MINEEDNSNTNKDGEILSFEKCCKSISEILWTESYITDPCFNEGVLKHAIYEFLRTDYYIKNWSEATLIPSVQNKYVLEKNPWKVKKEYRITRDKVQEKFRSRILEFFEEKNERIMEEFPNESEFCSKECGIVLPEEEENRIQWADTVINHCINIIYWRLYYKFTGLYGGTYIEKLFPCEILREDCSDDIFCRLSSSDFFMKVYFELSDLISDIDSFEIDKKSAENIKEIREWNFRLQKILNDKIEERKIEILGFHFKKLFKNFNTSELEKDPSKKISPIIEEIRLEMEACKKLKVIYDDQNNEIYLPFKSILYDKF